MHRGSDMNICEKHGDKLRGDDCPYCRIFKLTWLLEDCKMVMDKLGDENTYRIHESSPAMAEALDNLQQAVSSALKSQYCTSTESKKWMIH